MKSDPASESSASIVAYLKGVREERGLSIREVGRRAELPHATVRKIESGENMPTLYSLFRIANALETKLSKAFKQVESE